MLDIAVLISLAGLSIALGLSAYRALKGPQVPDRVVALDAVTVILVSMVVIGSIRLRETSYLDYALVLSVLSFVTTVAFAKYVERGGIIEPDQRNDH
jgi:multicomponent Na+:H+ antiporter subunit F